jgi:hypothetical protein
MACDCGRPDCPERHGITLRPIERTPCEHLYDIACRELSEVMAQRDELLAALKMILTSGAPNQHEHPAMWDAWQCASHVVERMEAK